MQDPLSRVDLNLLVAYQVLMQEKNVTRAAERLFVTQPAMSKTLNRLRTLIDDDLFVRSSHGLTPTPKTLELEKPVNEVIAQLTGMPAFINKLRQQAPKVLLLSQNIDDKWEDRLRSGSLDFAIVAKNKFSDDFVTEKLML